MKLRDKTILIISNEAWGYVWFSKHNYAHELSRHNRVVFMDPAGPWKPVNLLGCAPSLKAVSPTLSVLRYRNRLPILNKWFYRLNERWTAYAIDRFLRKNGLSPDPLITFDPTRFTTPKRLSRGLTVFLCVDKYTFGFHGERDLCRNVDGIITISEQLTVRYEHFYKPLLTIGHSISSDEFEASPPAHVPVGYGLYVGTIDSRIDHARVAAMLDRFPSVPFLFIGRMALKDNDPARDIYLSGKYPNLEFLGVKPFKELKSFIAGSRFCLAPMDPDFPGNDISHHKTFQYLALGKPVFSTVFSEYRPIRDLLYMENDLETSLATMQRFLETGEPGHLAGERIAHARSATYERTFERMEEFLDSIRSGTADTRRTIFLFSNEPWSDMWFSKHHYAAELAKLHHVYFVAMPDHWKMSDLFSWRARASASPEGVHVVSYRNTLPRRAGAFVGRWSGRKLARLRPDPHPVCWTFNPLAYIECRTLKDRGARIIYHTVDPYQAFKEDTLMARLADQMVCVNSWFMAYYEPLNPRRLLVPHGIRKADRLCHQDTVERLRSEHGRFALFAASLSDLANYRLLTRASERFPDLKFIVVGSKFPLPDPVRSERDRFMARPNVTYLGVKHPDELKDFARAAALGLLAYDFEVRRAVPDRGGRTPLKVLTYLAQHCPVVTTNNSYIPELEDRGCFKADTEDEFLRKIAEVLDGRSTVDTAAVDRYLDGMDYGTLTKRILQALDEARP